MRFLLPVLAACIVASLAFLTALPAQTANTALADWWNGEYASGDWNGRRAELEERGVHPWLYYEQDLAGNVTGGNSRGVTNSGSIEAGVILDFEKILGWRATTFLVRFVDRNGTDLSTRRIGNFFPVQQDFGVETLMLQSLALEHTFFLANKNALSLKAGRVAAADDFAGSPLYGLHMSNAISGAPKALFTTNAFSSYPGSVWGARLKFMPENNRWYAKFGVYQANDRLYTGDKHGFQWDIRHNDGVTLVSEFGYTQRNENTSATEAAAAAGVAPLPGHFWAGAYVSFWDIPRIDGRGTEDTSHAFYFHADQMLWRGGPAGDAPSITAWAVATFAPRDSVQVMTWQLSAGFAYKGVVPARPHDKLVFGISHGHFGSDYDVQQQQQSPTGESPTGETVLELAYRIKLNRFNTLSPDIQYIVNPAGLSSRSNALVLGMRLNVVF